MKYTKYISDILYPILVKIIYLNKYNSQVTKDTINENCNWVGTSETTRATNYKYDSCINRKEQGGSKSGDNSWFNEWLAGLIDGDGSLLVSKKGYCSCEIIVDIKDEKLLKYIQNKIGGSIKLRSGVKALRWRLHNKKDMLNLINRINGNIRHTSRLKQLYKVCELLNIPVILPKPLIYNNGWFIGFFDADGTITYNIINKIPQLTISVKNKLLIDVQPYKEIFGGNIYYDKGQNGYFKWCIQSKVDILNIYNILKYSKSYKSKRIFLINNYYDLFNLKAYKTPEEGGSDILYKAWLRFNSKWEYK